MFAGGKLRRGVAIGHLPCAIVDQRAFQSAPRASFDGDAVVVETIAVGGGQERGKTATLGGNSETQHADIVAAIVINPFREPMAEGELRLCVCGLFHYAAFSAKMLLASPERSNSASEFK